MSRILEFQPTDEQTVVARVLVELHQAIDSNFPGANPSNRQFSKTILTNQSESTRADNSPPFNSGDRVSPKLSDESPAFSHARDTENLSITPKSRMRPKKADAPLQTAELQKMMGESRITLTITKLLLVFLALGIGTLLWLIFAGNETFSTILSWFNQLY